MSPTAAMTQTNANSGKRDYGYCNARLRGMRARLLRRDMLERLTEAPDLRQLIQDLMQTEYAADLEETLLHGRGPSEVAEALSISKRTVETHRAAIMAKIGLRSRAELVQFALENGLWAVPERRR